MPKPTVWSVVILAVAGCATYVAHPIDSPPPAGTEVRAQLTAPGAIRASELFGRPIQEFEGQLVGWTADTLYIGLRSATQLGRPWESVDTIGLSRPDLALLEEKRIDRTKTALVVGGSSVVIGAAIVALFRQAAETDGGNGPDGDLILIPIFSFVH